MSTVVNVIAVETIDITFGEVITISELNINNFLFSIGLNNKIKLKVNVHANDERYVHHVQPTDKFEWKDDEYVWFSIDGIRGGTDAHCKHIEAKDIDPVKPWWQLEDLQLRNKTINNIEGKLEKCKMLNRRWYFRRSAGQTGTIAMSSGLIAASVAQLTNGILWSDDGAWDYQRFPAQSKDFLDWYFRPEKALEPSNAEWAGDCIEGIKKDITAAKFLHQKNGLTWLKLFRK